MLENTAAVVESLIAALREGRRTPDQVPPGLTDRGLWDGDALEQVLQALHERNRTGRLSARDLDALCSMLDRWSRTTPGEDLDATVEFAGPTPPVAEPSAPAGRPLQQVELRRGSVLRDRYVLEEIVGSGGMSHVFRARDMRRDAGDSSRIAIKVLRPDLRRSEPANARLKREFRQTQALRHAGVVRMFDLDCDDGTWFITMELLVGTTLDARFKRLPATADDTTDAMKIASSCAEVLAFAHRQGVLHGDFKPGNVFLEDDGTVKVLDFGTAPASPQSAIDTAADPAVIPRAGTRAYASPEVLAGEPPEPRDDVFSLACVVYELLSGRHPFGRLPAPRARDLSLAATPLPPLSAVQNAALASGLAWQRAARPPSVQEFMRSLTRPAIEPVPLPVQQRSSPERVPRRWPVALVAAAVLLVALWALLPGEDREPAGRRGDAANSRPPASEVAPAAPTPANLVGPDDAEAPSLSAAIPEAVPAQEPVSPPSTTAQREPDPPSPARVAARPRAQVRPDHASIVVSEGSPAAVVLLRRQGNLAASVQVAWQLSNGSARLQEDIGGPVTGTTRFLPGQTTRAVYVPLIDDSIAEGEETFSLRMTSRSAAVDATGDVTITIVDDDDGG